MRKPLSAVLAASLVATAVPATAQQAFRLDEIVFAGGLSPVPQAALGRSVTVITADEIRDRQIDQLPDLLHSLPGIAVNRTGGPGGLVDLRLRGTEARHVLVIVDGVRLDLPRFGGTNITGLQTADIERIEILRGPQSVFFGSDTIGGVISITTTRARDPGFAGRAGVEAGSDRTIGLDFGLTQRGARGGIALRGVLRNEGGFDVSATPGGARDGMRNRTLNLSGDFALTETWRIGAQLRLRNQRNEFDGFDFGAPAATVVFDQDNFDVIRERIASVFAEGELLDGRMELTLRASRFRDTRTGFADAVFSSRQRHTRTELAARGTIALDAPTLGAARHTLAFGAEQKDDRFRDLVAADFTQSRRQRSLIAEYRGAVTETLDVQIGLRRDFNDRFSDFTTWSAAVSQAIPATGTRLRASTGTGVMNPSLFQQFGFANNFEPNPDLVPEQSRGWDVGIDQTLLDGRARVSLTYFENRLTDRIISVPGSAPGIQRPDNADGRSRRTGWEATAEADLTDTLRLRGAYTYTDARGEAGERLVRRPRHELALGLDWAATDRTLVSVDARRVVNNLDFDFEGFGRREVRLPDYTVVNIAARHALTDGVELTARVNNLFDRRYQEVLGYAAQPRTAYVGLAARF